MIKKKNVGEIQVFLFLLTTNLYTHLEFNTLTFEFIIKRSLLRPSGFCVLIIWLLLI